MKPQPPGAIASLAFGICALLTGSFPFIGVVLGLVAVILSRRAQAALVNTQDTYHHSSLPIAGMVTGMIGMILSIIATIFMFLLLSIIGAIITAAAHAVPPPVVETPLLW